METEIITGQSLSILGKDDPNYKAFSDIFFRVTKQGANMGTFLYHFSITFILL